MRRIPRPRRALRVAAPAAAAVGVLVLVAAAAASPALMGKARTTRVSVSSSGRQEDSSGCAPSGQTNCANWTSSPSISADGRFVAF